MIKEHSCGCGETDPSKFYPRRKTRCKACCISKVSARTNEITDKTEHRKRTKTWIENNPLQYRLSAAKARAKRKQIDFTIDLPLLETLWQVQDKRCYYTGIEMETCNAGNFSISIDRKDSSKGYIPSNVVLCTTISNLMKHTLTESEFKDIVTTLYENMC